MKMRSLWIFLFLFCCTTAFLSEASGQQNFDVQYVFEQDTIRIKGGQTFANKIFIENRTDRKIELTPTSNQTMALNGMIKLPEQIILEANEKKSYPLKYIADRHTITSNLQVFTIGFSAQDKALRIAPPVSFHTRLAEDRSLSLSTEQSEYYFDPSGNPIQFILHAANRGLVPITFRLLLSEVPEGLEFTGETMSTSLQPGAQILLPFTATIKSKNNTIDFSVTIQALDESGHELASRRIRMMSISSVKRFGASSNFLNDPYQNSVALRYMSMSHHSSIYQVQGNGEVAFDDKRSLKYRLNLDYYQNQESINIYDTYLDYEDKDWGVKVGNIYENLDYTLSGRGIKASYKLEGDRAISVYGVENSYMLVSQMNNLVPSEKIIAARYAFNTAQRQQGDLTYLHSNNSYRSVHSHQISGRTHLQVGADQQLGIEGGYSLESAYQGAKKHAVAIGAHYHYNFNDYQLTSNNYYSSPYYAGLRRGLVQSDTRLSRSLQEGKKVTARVSFMDNNPKYQPEDRGFYFHNHNRIQIYELGYNTSLGKLHMNIRPYIMLQDLKNNRFPLYENYSAHWHSSAIRTAANLSFFSHAHRFSINTDYGYTYKNTANRPLAPFHSVRINGNYRNRLFGFNTYIQINPYYLSDLLSSSRGSNYQLYSFGPSTQFSAFGNALHVQLSTMYSYYGFSQTNNVSVTGNARWRMKGNWSLTADVFYAMLQTTTPYDFQHQTHVATHSFNNRQIRVGIEKSFAQIGSPHGHRLRLHYFEDRNNNGIKDRNEPPIEGILVKIDKDVALSDKNGSVKFKNMATGTYAVLIENNQGWSSPAPVDVLMTKNQSLEIPLVKTKILKGQIKVVSNKYQETKPELSGIRIHAVDSNGREYETMSNAAGSYAFYLPAGTYTLFIPTEGLPFSIENEKNEIELKEDVTGSQLDFYYKDERRKIGITRF